MTTGQGRLEEFLNRLEGKVIPIAPNVTAGFFRTHRADFPLIVKRVS
jgi:hypothetical protein